MNLLFERFQINLIFLRPTFVLEEPLEVVEIAIMATQDDFRVMYVILICDGGFLSINLELSGSVAGLYLGVVAQRERRVGHLYNASRVGMYTGVIVPRRGMEGEVVMEPN